MQKSLSPFLLLISFVDLLIKVENNPSLNSSIESAKIVCLQCSLHVCAIASNSTSVILLSKPTSFLCFSTRSSRKYSRTTSISSTLNASKRSLASNSSFALLMLRLIFSTRGSCSSATFGKYILAGFNGTWTKYFSINGLCSKPAILMHASSLIELIEYIRE